MSSKNQVTANERNRKIIIIKQWQWQWQLETITKKERKKGDNNNNNKVEARVSKGNKWTSYK